jgi:tetratricopeptide (TPR) repeat protein
MRHVSKSSLKRVLGGTAGKPETALVSDHVFKCQVCKKFAREVVAELREEMRAQRPTSRPGGPLRVLAEIFSLEQETSIDRTLALAERATMRNLSLKAQKERAGTSRVCKSWPFVSLLIQELRQQNSYEVSENLGSLTAACIQAMDPYQYTQELRNDLASEMWVAMANARRKAAEWTRAAKAIEQADALREKGTGNVWLRGYLMEIRAAMEADQGQRSDALGRLALCREIYETVEDWAGVARSLIASADCLSENDPLQALRLTKQALPLIPETDLGLTNIANHLEVECLIDLGQVAEAAALFGLCLERHETGRVKIRRDWIGARLLHAAGYPKEAERLHGEVVTADLRAELYKDAFLDLLFLFNLHVKEGDLDKAVFICRRALEEAELAAFSHEQIRGVWQFLMERVQSVEQDLIRGVRAYMAVHWRHPANQVPLFAQKTKRDRR